MADQEEDFSSLPLTDRFAHKNWKVRKEAYETAANEFKNAQTEQDPLVREFVNDSGLWKAAVSDSNVAAHQEAVSALCQFLEIAGTQGCTRTRGFTLVPLAEKGLISTKPVTKQKALEAILLYVELDKPDPILEELLPLLSHKLPKIVAAVLSALTSIYHDFGCKTVEPKSVLKTLPKVFGHADKNVRAEAQNLAVELYRWLREGIKPLFWGDLKPVQQTDIEKLFEKVKDEPIPKPERLLRSQQARQAAAAAIAPVAEEEPEEGEDEDGGDIDLAPEAVDVFVKAPKDLQERLSSPKWKDRKEALDELHAAINVPSIQDGPFDEIIRGLAKSMKDANIAVVTVAANCVELLARGLRRGFSKYRSMILDPMLERLKERKQSVVDALAAALDAVASTSNLSEYLEGLLEFLKHKNPQVKLESTRFLTRVLKLSREAPTIPEVKMISDNASKLLSDSQETQRSAGAEILGVLLKIMGERIMNAHFEGLDDIRKARIKEFADTAEVKAKYKPKAAPAPKTAAPPIGRKAPAGTKKPTAAPAKKPAPSLAPSVEAPSPAPLQSRTPARPGLQKPGAPRGLRPPSSVGPPGKKLNNPSSQAASASPHRNVYSPPMGEEEEEEEPLPPPKISRGLTGRHLSKPGSTSEAASFQSQYQTIASLPSHERMELDEVRLEVERLRMNNERLNKESSDLTTRVQELEDHNAQLIEDHTRDVLSIKAKETQLVRARSDADCAEQTAQQLQREVDRLKRELSRTARATSPRVSDFGQDPETYRAVGAPQRTFSGEGKENLPVPSDSEDPLAKKRVGMLSPPPYAAVPARPSSRSTNTSASPSRPASARPYGASSGYGQSASNASRSIGNPPSHVVMPPPGGGSGIGRATSRVTGGMNGTGVVAGRDEANGTAGGRTQPGEEGQESWRRAAEVTQNLKARIELMRQRQNNMATGR